MLKQLADAPAFRRVAVRALGADLWERYERVPPAERQAAPTDPQAGPADPA
jgi:hypothetical protein